MTQPASRINADALLAWQLQAEEYKKVSNGKLPLPIGTKTYKRLSQGHFITYHIRKVKGDRDCFFHAVNQPKLTRDELIRILKQNAAKESVRKSFASEIRQFIYLEAHNDSAEQEARNHLFTDEIRNLFTRLIASENNLQKVIVEAREQLGQRQTQGKKPEELLQLLQQGSLSLAVQFSSCLQTVSQVNDEINQYCFRESVFTSYVDKYLSKARGFIPFMRTIEGESVKTPIDVINELFQLNIQIYLPDGTRVTASNPGEEISIYHNGINHFSGLNRVPDLPVHVGATIAQLPASEKPEEYTMYHALQNSHIGIQYQLLILMNKALKLMAQGQKDFEATFESTGQGNLDDITFIYKNQQNVRRIEAFQVKHYSGGIAAADFVNKVGGASIAKGKNEKMHIGKFLDGWLSLKAKYPNLSKDALLSIVYCNQGLDGVLGSSIQGEIFAPDFIEKKTLVLLGGRKNKGIDFFDLMFEQSKLYLTKDNLHSDYISLPENQQKVRFKEFLRSFRFKMHRKDLKQLEESILIQLSKVMKNGAIKYDLLFMHLCYALGEWFRHDAVSRRTPKLTPQVFDELLQDSLAKGELSVYLQGISYSTLSHFSNRSGDQTVPRKELEMLENAVKQPGWIALAGEKGIGKTGLIKELLSRYQPYEYLFLATKDLINNIDLKTKVGKVLKKASVFCLVVLDGAELLLAKKSEQEEILKLFSLKSLRVVLTITPEAVVLLPQATTIIQVKSLNIDAVLNRFPKLEPYKDVKSLMKLATIPFHLNNIVALLDAWNTTDFARLTADKARLEEKLTEAVICGKDVKLRNTWTRLAVALSKGEKPRNGNLDLRQDVFNPQTMQFSHDLFFEYGLIYHWQTQWEIQNGTLGFWKNLPDFLKFDNPIFVLAKWYILYKKELSTDLMAVGKDLVDTPVFNTILSLAIVAKDNALLKSLLNHHPKFVSANSGDPGILLAIRNDLPEAVEALLKFGESPHHPDTGSLVVDTYSAHYAKKKYGSTSSEESSGEEESIDEDDAYSFSGSERSSEDSYHGVPSESDDEDMGQFACNLMLNPEKYWSAGFDESPGYTDMDGDWVPNLRFEQRPNNELSYLHQAVLNRSIKSIGILLKSYTCPQMIDLVNSCQETPLHLGALSKDLKIFEMLVSGGASVHSKDVWGETPLHNAVYTGSIDSVRLLLDHGADPKAMNDLGLTPLHLAFARLDLEMTNLLISPVEGDIPKLFHSMTVGDLLDAAPKTKKAYMEEFVIDLIAALGYEGDLVDDLMTLVEHRAQINEYDPDFGFDYTDEESEFEYALSHGDMEHIDVLTDYILSDSDHIAEVLESDSFSDLQEELVEGWFEKADPEQHQNLKTCVEQLENETLLKLIRADKQSQFEDAIDDHLYEKLEALTGFILDEDERIKAVLDTFEEQKEELVKAWIKHANGAQLQNLRNYAKLHGDEEVLLILDMKRL